MAGSQIEGSPFYVDVFDLNSIRIDNFRHGIVGDPARFSGNCLTKSSSEVRYLLLNGFRICEKHEIVSKRKLKRKKKQKKPMNLTLSQIIFAVRFVWQNHPRLLDISHLSS